VGCLYNLVLLAFVRKARRVTERELNVYVLWWTRDHVKALTHGHTVSH
jgi:hypothetical protein